MAVKRKPSNSEKVLVLRRPNYWRKSQYERVDLQTLAERYLRGCKRHGLTLSEAINVLRMADRANS
jgi:hypothetical protein